MRTNASRNIKNDEAALESETQLTSVANHRRRFCGALLWLMGLFVAVALLLCRPIPVKADEDAGPTDQNAGTLPCKGLEPYNNIDELLYQFYINLDSECLFKMSAEELEKTWDIKILSSEREKAGGIDPYDFSQKPYKTEKDAFYLKMLRNSRTNDNIFSINITEAYYKEHATLFPDGNFPQLLPEPLKIDNRSEIEGQTPFSTPPLYPQKGGINYYTTAYHYYWLNSQKTSMILLRGYGSVKGVQIMKYVPPAFK